MSQFFASGGQWIGASASASVLDVLMNIQDWFPLALSGWSPATQGTLKSLLQHHSSKASVLQCSDFFIVQCSHPYMTTGKTIAFRRTFVGKVMSLLFNMFSKLVIAFLPRSKHQPEINTTKRKEAPTAIFHRNVFHFSMWVAWEINPRGL